MNINREVIRDLYPLVEAGEASADTQALVKEFLEHDPEFARQLQAQAAEPALPAALPPLPPDHEAKALKQTRRLLHGYDWLLLFAMLFSAFAFGRIVSDTSWDVSPRNFIITAAIAGVFWVAFFTRLVWVQRQVYRRGTKPRS